MQVWAILMTGRRTYHCVRCIPPHSLRPDVTPTHGPRLRRIKTPSLLSWYRGRRQSRYTAPSPGSSRRRGKKAALFAVPLNEVIINDQLPEVLQVKRPPIQCSPPPPPPPPCTLVFEHNRCALNKKRERN